MLRAQAIKNIHYPKRKKKVDDNKVFGIQEPVRRNMYDVLLENFDIADRKTYIHRVIYVGEQYFGRDEQIIEYFSDTVKRANAVFHHEKVTGFLLIYTKYFIHMIEGDEDAIQHQISLLYNHELVHKLGRTKILIHLSHIKQRFIPDWTYYFGTPAKLLGQIKVECTIQETGRHVYNFIKKFYNLVMQFVQDNYYQDEISESLRSPQTESSELETNVRTETALRTCSSVTSLRSSIVGINREPYRVNLPETELLDFILKSEYTQTLKAYHVIYGVVPQRDIYKDKVWPVPSDFIPYDVFCNALNITTELSKGRSNDSTRGEEFKESTDETLPKSYSLESYAVSNYSHVE